MAKDFTNEKRRLQNEIRDCIDGKLPRYSSIKILEHTPDILIDVGLLDKPILFSQSHLRNCLHAKGKNPHWHGLTINQVISVQNILKAPAIIMDSFTDSNSIMVVGDIVDNDNEPIVATIKTNGIGQYEAKTVSSNYLTSIYGKRNLENIVSRALTEDTVLYANKTKVQNLGSFAKLQLRGKFPSDFGFNSIIHKSKSIVNDIVKNFEKDEEMEV